MVETFIDYLNSFEESCVVGVYDRSGRLIQSTSGGSSLPTEIDTSQSMDFVDDFRTGDFRICSILVRSMNFKCMGYFAVPADTDDRVVAQICRNANKFFND